MQYKYRFIIYLILLIIILVVGWFLFMPKVLSAPSQPLTSCFYEQPRISPIPVIYTLGTLGISTIECMIEAESGGNPKAYNPLDTDGRPKYGILQFDSRTFKGYCVDNYYLPDDLWNPEIQRECADNMIKNGLGYHWPTYKRCLN